MKSNKVATISTSQNQLYLSFSDLERFSDDSSVKFCLNARSQYFEIHNYIFYSDTLQFSNFRKGIRNIYDKLEGTIELAPTYEEGLIKITGDKSGHVYIKCEVYCFGEIDDVCKLGFEVDQTFLPKFIEELKLLYLDLGFDQ